MSVGLSSSLRRPGALLAFGVGIGVSAIVAAVGLSAAAGTVSSVSVSLSSPTTGQRSTYTVAFTTSQSGDLHKGNSIVITAPNGTAFSGHASDVTVTTSFNSRATSVAVSSVRASSARLVVVIGTEVHKNAGVSMSIASVLNPAAAGSYRLSVATSADASPVSSPPYSVVSATPAYATGLAYERTSIGPRATDAVSSAPIVTDAWGNSVATNGTYSISGLGTGLGVDPATGLVTASSGATLGTWTVTFTQGAASTSAQITVQAGPPASASGLSYASGVLVPPGTDAVASAPVVTDASGNPVATNGTYSISGPGTGLGVDPATGLVTASSGATLGTWTVTFTQGAASTSAHLLVRGQQSPLATTTLALSSPNISTFAGNTGTTNINGTGTGASFATMGGGVVVGGGLYVASKTAVRRVDLGTGAVTTIAGDLSLSGCTDTATASAVQFQNLGDVTTDGIFLYVVDCGRIRRVALSDGATSTVVSAVPGGTPRFLTFGPDGNLYVVADTNAFACSSFCSWTIDRLDPITGSVSAFTSTVGGKFADAITADATRLWVHENNTGNLYRVDLPSGTVTLLAGGPGANALTSAGSYLYASNGTSITRIDKATGAQLVIAGSTTKGFADGPGATALFSAVSGLASDGSALWVVDSGNHRIRRAA